MNMYRKPVLRLFLVLLAVFPLAACANSAANPASPSCRRYGVNCSASPPLSQSGPPRPATVRAIEGEMPRLRDQGVHVISIDRDHATGSLVIHARSDVGKRFDDRHAIEAELSSLAGVPVVVAID